MRFFVCVVGAICKSPYAVACVFSSNRSHCKFAHIAIPPCGRANCNSPLHMCFLDVRKYTCKYTKKHHGHGMDLFACVVGAKSASWRSGVCDANRPYRGLCFQVLKIVKINTINKIKPINNEKFFIFAL